MKSMCACLGAMCAAWIQTAIADLAHRRGAVVDVVQKVSPAVVYIGAEQIIEWRSSDPFFEFFGIGRERRRSVESLGSGVIIDPNGTVVTNDHVIRGASAIHVVLADGRQLEAEVLGADADNDLAVLKVSGKGPFPTAKMGISSDLMIGETMIAIGSPFGLKKTVTVGVLSAIGRSFKANDRVYNDFLQTDASINPGNSGGPLLNIDGEVIGINTAIYAGGQGIGFAIPADKVRRIVSELTQFGKVRPAWIGIDAEPLNAPVARSLGWDRNYGAVVAGVDSGSPAEKAGIQPGDIIEEVAGTRVEDAEDFNVRMRGYPARTPVALTLFHKGTTKTVSVTPVEYPPKLAESLAWERLGIRVEPARSGLLINSVRRGSVAARIGLVSGDLVLKVNNQRTETLESFREALIAARASKSVLLLVGRGRFGYYVTLPL
jgi:serine protease Do